MEHRKLQGERFATPEDEKRAQQIVDEMLGPGFYIDIMSLPKNVGVVGDKRVFGHTALISSDALNTTAFYDGSKELLADVSTRICNEVTSVCRVLYDITPSDGEF